MKNDTKDQESKSSYFGKINNIDKLWIRPIKKKREGTHINTNLIRNEKRRNNN